MIERHRPSYAALVAALRTEFNPLALEAMKIRLREHRHDLSSLGTLVHAVFDAQDLAYGTAAGLITFDAAAGRIASPEDASAGTTPAAPTTEEKQ